MCHRTATSSRRKWPLQETGSWAVAMTMAAGQRFVVDGVSCPLIEAEQTWQRMPRGLSDHWRKCCTSMILISINGFVPTLTFTCYDVSIVSPFALDIST